MSEPHGWNGQGGSAVLTGAEADRAQAVAVAVASRLLDGQSLERARARTDQLLEASGAPPRTWSPSGLSGASASGALLCAELDRLRPMDGWDRHGHGFLSLAARDAEGDGAPLGLYGGLAGVGYAAQRLAAGRPRYGRLLASIDEAIVVEVRARERELATASGLPAGRWDLISGITGIGVYLLGQLVVPQSRAALEQILAALVGLSSDADGGPRWATPAENLFGYLREQTPDGCVNCGVAHGVPGALALMALARLSGVVVTGQLDAIHRTAAWLAAQARSGSWGPEWPAAVPLRETSSAAAWPRTHPGWCYGNAGVARALWLTGCALEDDAYLELAMQAIRQALARQDAERSLTSATICHGVAGLAQVALRMSASGADQELAASARDLCLDLLERFDEDSAFGFRDHAPGRDRELVEVDDPTLLSGATGTALVLLAAGGDGDPGWDRALLLS
jgi:lantibiotic biosynthesis protein